MVALCFAERYAAQVNHIVVLTPLTGPGVSTAWRSVQRQIVREAIARVMRSRLKLARRAGDGHVSQSIEFALRFGVRRRALRTASASRLRITVCARRRLCTEVSRRIILAERSIDLHAMDATQCIHPQR